MWIYCFLTSDGPKSGQSFRPSFQLSTKKACVNRFRIAATNFLAAYVFLRRAPLRQQLSEGAAKQAAPLQRLITGLKTAALAWAEIRTMHDDRRGVLSDYGDRLANMVTDAERRLSAIRDIGESKPMAVKLDLVRALAESCRKVGLDPTATGRVSEHEEPTWFQKFVVVLNNQILGDNGWGLAESDHKARAVHSNIAKALSGYAKPGISRK